MAGRPRGSAQCKVTMPMLTRMKALREKRLSVPAIRAVIELDYGKAPSERMIRYHLGSSGDDYGYGKPCGWLGMSAGPSSVERVA